MRVREFRFHDDSCISCKDFSPISFSEKAALEERLETADDRRRHGLQCGRRGERRGPARRHQDHHYHTHRTRPKQISALTTAASTTDAPWFMVLGYLRISTGCPNHYCRVTSLQGNATLHHYSCQGQPCPCVFSLSFHIGSH